jgi:hypothetical protein
MPEKESSPGGATGYNESAGISGCRYVGEPKGKIAFVGKIATTTHMRVD